MCALGGMDSQLSPSAQRQLDRFCRQYSQLELDLDFPEDQWLRNDAFQQALYALLFNPSSGHEPPKRYQLRVLKLLLAKIEQSIQDWDEEGISDDLMVHLSSLLSSSIPSEAASAQQKSFVTYTLSSLGTEGNEPPLITLLESRSLLAAAGTTGLRTWEAALHLGEYLSTHGSSLVQDRSILELGAGTGYVSILCAKHLGASNVIATDGSSDVVASLPDNFHLNGLPDTSIIQGLELRWGEPLTSREQSEWNGNQKVDLVLGADVTYDEGGIAALLSTIDDLFDLYPNVKIIIAATRRNPKTFTFFQEACLGKGYKIEESDFAIKAAELQMGPFYRDKVPIRICLITKS